ncbi:MAG: dimethyl sulfoxide reductase anchor subunit [Burkholderiales bacterium]|nr:dimethyl sulfoxide reductase anchor subunit [Burkholderiales bacterium]
MSYGPNPWQQLHWDARAAVNFMTGGAGSGLIVFGALAGGPRWAWLIGAALIAAGLLSVAMEIGRPLRSLNVYINPRTSWMSREAIAALVLFAGVAGVWFGVPMAPALAALAALVFVYCQGQMLRRAKGIQAWREPRIVPLVIATGLAEGGGLWLVTAGGDANWLVWALLGALLLARWALWRAWRARLAKAPRRALEQIDRAGSRFIAGTLLALAAVLLALVAPATALGGVLLPLAAWLAGLFALAGGWWFKFTLITRAAFNQGFAIPHLPVRGARRG